MKQLLFVFFILLHSNGGVIGQDADAVAKVELGSRTAKGGFQNEDEIRDKFNAWKTDSDSGAWLEAMNYGIADIVSVTAAKPHGEKADVELTVITNSAERIEKISIKLVSNPIGFNQIDKRWLATYSEMWNMPPEVIDALRLYVGETPPPKNSRDSKRMYLDELDEGTQAAVVEFFNTYKDGIISDLLSGDGDHAAGWLMVTFKATDKTEWAIRSSVAAIKHFAAGDVQIMKAGNLKTGPITMQRKGGDNGRPTANMLQFKMNPVALFDAPRSLQP